MADRPLIWTIIGAGMGGKGLLAHLGHDGHRLRIHDIDERVIAPLRAVGGVRTRSVAGAEGIARAEVVTTDLAEAVDGADVILVCTYGNNHDQVAAALAPLLRDGQTVILIQGHFLGAHLFREALRRAGSKAAVQVGEMDSYPYMVGILAPDLVQMGSVKARWALSAAPGRDVGAIMDRIGHAFPGLAAVPSPLHTAFVDLGGLFHVAGMITNVSRVENSETYNFYAANMVPSVCRLIEELDRERVAVARAYGITIADVRTWLAETYGLRHDDLAESLQVMAVTHYKYAPAPKSLEHRYLAQDVSCAVVGVDALGTVAGVPTPVSHAAARIACALTGRDFFAEGRNAEKLGLKGKSVDQVIAALSG